MNTVKISKWLDVLAYMALVAVFAWYFFVKPESEYVSLALLVICVLKLTAAMMKANFFEKEYKKLKEENDFLTSRLKDKN